MYIQYCYCISICVCMGLFWFQKVNNFALFSFILAQSPYSLPQYHMLSCLCLRPSHIVDTSNQHKHVHTQIFRSACLIAINRSETMNLIFWNGFLPDFTRLMPNTANYVGVGEASRQLFRISSAIRKNCSRLNVRYQNNRLLFIIIKNKQTYHHIHLKSNSRELSRGGRNFRQVF